MKAHIAYLRYVLRHKFFVLQECLKYGLWWRGLKHDWHKFLPSEWFPYVNYFYNKDGTKKKHAQIRAGYYKPTDTGDLAFDFAWLLHQKRADHHWQWWVLPEDDGGLKVMPMSTKARTEMLCDWRGAGRAQGFPNTWEWYDTNRDKIILTDIDRHWIEDELTKQRLKATINEHF